MGGWRMVRWVDGAHTKDKHLYILSSTNVYLMNNPKPRGCASDNIPQVMVVCIIPNDRESAGGLTKDKVIGMYERWLDHRCRCDRLNHPNSKYDIRLAVKFDLRALESLTNDNRYIIRFRTKKHDILHTKEYGKLDICFSSYLKVYARYNIFRGGY